MVSGNCLSRYREISERVGDDSIVCVVADDGKVYSGVPDRVVAIGLAPDLLAHAFDIGVLDSDVLVRQSFGVQRESQLTRFM